MFTTTIPPVGEVCIRSSGIQVLFAHTILHGTDSSGRTITIKADRFVWPNDYVLEYGYIHVVEYTIHGVATPCNLYRPIG